MSFKFFRFNCCGLDVHKTWIHACIGITDSNNHTEYKQTRFSSSTNKLNELRDLSICDIVKSPFIPPADIRELRNLVRYHSKLTCMITDAKKLAQNCLIISELKFDVASFVNLALNTIIEQI